jgi:probable F420-dependent oxidoreductase
MVALSVAASSTRHLLLHTHVYVLGYRNPFLAAKSLASIDAVSGGRLIAGVAAGYLKPEFAALGASFDDRGDRLDATLELLPRIWSGEVVEEQGDNWSARSVVALPRPTSRPGPPLWVGGNSRRAMRRAVTLADGWSPFAAPAPLASATRTAPIDSLDALGLRLAELQAMSDEAGRAVPPTVCFTPFSLSGLLAEPDGPLHALADEVAQLAELGVGWITLEIPGGSRTAVLDRAARVAEAVGLGRAV